MATIESPAAVAPLRRTLTIWERGTHPGNLVVRAAALAVALLVGLSMVFGNDLGWLFNLGFIAVCIRIALWVHPGDFFTVGVTPPLLLAAAVFFLAVFDRAAVAREGDGFGQAFVSGLANHAVPLVIGYGLTLAIIGLRQVAVRHDGRLKFTR